MATSFPLTDLPEELVAVVASHVSSSADLSHLALASKQLNRITTTRLYRRVYLFFGPEYQHYEIIFNFVLLFLERPQLAAYVQHLTIRGEWKRDWNAGRGTRISDLHPVLHGAISRLTANAKKKRAWADNVMGWDREEALFAVLLHTLPNLDTLDTSLKDMPGMHHRWLMRQISSPRVQLLGKLTHLGLGIPQRMGYLEVEMYKPWFELPSLKRVFLYGFNCARVHVGEADMAEHMEYLAQAIEGRHANADSLSTVEHLDVREGVYAFRPLCDLISAIRGLRTFRYDNDFGIDLEHRHNVRFFSLLVSALAMHASTLTAFMVPQAMIMAFPRAEAEDMSLHRLSNLQHLQLPMGYLLPVKEVGSDFDQATATKFIGRIPTSVRRLDLMIVSSLFEDNRCRDGLLHLLDLQAELLPCLTELCIYSEQDIAAGREMDKALQHHGLRSGESRAFRLCVLVRIGSHVRAMPSRVEWDGIQDDTNWLLVSSEDQ